MKHLNCLKATPSEALQRADSHQQTWVLAQFQELRLCPGVPPLRGFTCMGTRLGHFSKIPVRFYMRKSKDVNVIPPFPMLFNSQIFSVPSSKCLGQSKLVAFWLVLLQQQNIFPA